jgi:hypothetical protein
LKPFFDNGLVILTPYNPAEIGVAQKISLRLFGVDGSIITFLEPLHDRANNIARGEVRCLEYGPIKG